MQCTTNFLQQLFSTGMPKKHLQGSKLFIKMSNFRICSQISCFYYRIKFCGIYFCVATTLLLPCRSRITYPAWGRRRSAWQKFRDFVFAKKFAELVLRQLYSPVVVGELDRHELGDQCGGSGMFIPDPGFDIFHPGSRIRTVFIPDWHQRI